MRYLYSLFMYLLTPYLLVRLWWKGRHLSAYRERITERFCWDPMITTQFDVWIHAVSLGEVIAATPLIDELLKNKWRLLITTMTPTGAKQVDIRFAKRVVHRYIPYDMPSILCRFFKTNQPRIGVIIETELWPNLITYATYFRIPLLLVNARLSPRSFSLYKKAAFLFKPLLNQFQAILAQNTEEATRFKNLGVDNHRIAVFGNLKFDLQTQMIDYKMFRSFKNHWGNERLVIIAASTHDNEEEQVLSRLKILQDNIPGVVLLIAPRHPERFQIIAHLSREFGFNTGLRSQIETLTHHVEVVILDSIGELLGFYHISDYSFVGGSLVPIGGHNVLEPIAMRVPVLTGKHTYNFKTICHTLTKASAIELVEHADDLVKTIIALHQDKSRKNNLIDNASQVFENNKGAVARYVTKIDSLLNSPNSI